MLEMVSVAVPVFVSVTSVFPLDVEVVWFPKAILVGLRDTTAAIPVPDRFVVAFTVPKTFNVAVRLPVADGVNVRLIVQEELAATVPPFAHVPVPAFAKFVLFVPVIVK